MDHGAEAAARPAPGTRQTGPKAPNGRGRQAAPAAAVSTQVNCHRNSHRNSPVGVVGRSVPGRPLGSSAAAATATKPKTALQDALSCPAARRRAEHRHREYSRDENQRRRRLWHPANYLNSGRRVHLYRARQTSSISNLVYFAGCRPIPDTGDRRGGEFAANDTDRESWPADERYGCAADFFRTEPWPAIRST